MEAMQQQRLRSTAVILVMVTVCTWIPIRLAFLSEFFWGDLLLEGGFVVYWLLSRYLTPVMAESPDNGEGRVAKAFNFLMIFPLASVTAIVAPSLAQPFLLSKLLLFTKVGQVRRLVESYDTLHPVASRLIPLILIMPLTVHNVACGWVWLGSGTAGTTEFEFYDYCRAVYWAITTLATVGYGDISAKTIAQMAYASLTMIIGVAFFGFVLSNVASLLARLDAAREHYLASLDRTESFMRFNGIPTGLRLRVREYYRYIWNSRRGYDDSEILESLPSKLKAEVSLFINAAIIEKVPFLNGAARECVEDIVLQLKPQVAVPNEIIFHAGDPGDAMYFVHRGRIEIFAKTGISLAVLNEGSFFGEMALINSHDRSATAKALDYCDLFVLKRQAFDRVLNRHPIFAQHLHEVIAHRKKSEHGSAA